MKHKYLPEGWRWVRLQDVFERIQRPIENNVENVLSITATVGFVDQAEKFGRVIAGKNLERYILLQHGEFAYNKGNSNSYPQGCIYMLEEFDQGAVPNVYYCFGAISEEIYTEFYKFYFESGALNSQLRQLINSGVRNDGLLNLPADHFFRMTIPLPPLDEQRRIAEVLRDADANLARVEAQIEAAKEVKRGVMQRLFTYGLGDEHTQTRRSDFGHIPHHWHIIPLEQCAYVQTGAAKGRNFNGGDVISVPYLRVANVQDGYLDLSEIKYIEIREDEFERYSLQSGDVVLTEGGDLDKLGRGFIWRGEIPNCIHQNHVFAVRVNPESLTPEYLSYLVQSDYGRAYFLSAAKQTTNLASVNSTQLKAFPVLLPDFDEQYEIAAILSAHDATISNLQVEVVSLREVKRGLMQKLLSGEVRV